MFGGEMKDRIHRVAPFLEVVFFLIFFAVALTVNLSCKDEDDPLSSGECGSGRTSWDEKAEVCRDIGNNRLLPSKCCGH